MPDRDRQLDGLRVALRVAHLQIEALHEQVSNLRREVETYARAWQPRPQDEKARQP